MFTFDRFIEFIANHYIYSLALAVVTYLLIQDLWDSVFKRFASISPLMAVTKMNEADTIVLDAREPDEFAKGHIESALNVPLSKLSEQLPKLEGHKKKQVLVACENGTRSASAGKVLSKAGFENVAVIAGGMLAWSEDYKLPIKVSGKKQKA
jgi:rhodanese-related sulfurtransferase